MSEFFALYPGTGTALIFSVCANVGLLILMFLRGCDFEVTASVDELPEMENRTVHVWKADGSYEQRSFSTPAAKGFDWRRARDGKDAA